MWRCELLEKVAGILIRLSFWGYAKVSDSRATRTFIRQIPRMGASDIRAIEDDTLLLKIALRHPGACMQALAASLIKNNKLLHGLAMDTNLPEIVREAAVQGQTNEHNLLVAILASGDVLVAQAAAERLKKPASFEVVLDPTMKMVTVRRIAANKCPLSVLIRLRKDPDPDVQAILDSRLAVEMPFGTPGGSLVS